MSKGKKQQYKPQPWEHDRRYKSRSYTRLYDSILASEAWLALSDSAARQYLILRMQYTGRFNQTDGNGNVMIKCPYKDIRKFGIGSNETIANNFRQLEAYGFIVIQGGGFHIASNYKFSDKWQNLSKEDIEQIKQDLKNESEQRKKAREAKREAKKAKEALKKSQIGF